MTRHPSTLALSIAVLTMAGAGPASASEWLIAPDTAAHQRFVRTLDRELEGLPPALEEDSAVTGDDLVLAVGTDALEEALAIPSEPEILAAMVPRLTLEELAGDRRVAAVYFDQPELRQFRLVAELSMDLRRLATVLGPASQRRRDALGAAAAETEIGLEAAVVDGPDGVIDELERLLPEADAFLALPDPAVHNRRSVRNILLATYRARVPTVAFSASYVRAGAVAGIYSEPEDMAPDAARLLREHRGSGWPEHAAPRIYPDRFQVLINRRVARSLGVHAPTEEELVRRIRALEGDPVRDRSQEEGP